MPGHGGRGAPKLSMLALLTAYSTNKKVRVVDWRLGYIHLASIGAIVVYVVLYELFYKSKAFTELLPVSTVRMSLQEPVLPGCTDVFNPSPECDNTLTDVRTLPYCLQSPPEIGREWKFPRFDCIFRDAVDAVDLEADKSIALTTRMSSYVQNRTCWPSDFTCPKMWTSLLVNASAGPSSPYKVTEFLAGVENFTLLFDNNAYASTTTDTTVSWSLEAAALNTTGKLFVGPSALGDELCAEAATRGMEPTLDRFGTYPDNVATTAPCYVSPQRALDGSTYDTFVVRDLLAATGLDLSAATGFNNHSTRYEGTIVVVKLVYGNIRPWGLPSRTPVYTYEIDWLEESKFKTLIISEENETTRTVQDRHGIWFVVTVNGSFMYFDAQNFIVQMSSFFSLLAIATFVVDFIMIYILPERVDYKAARYSQVISQHERCACFQSRPLQRSSLHRNTVAPTEGADVYSKLTEQDGATEPSSINP